MELTLIPIGNSLGVRLPKRVLDSLGLGPRATFDLTQTRDTLVLRPKRETPVPRDGWAQTFIADPAPEENLWGDLPPAEAWEE